MKPGGKSRGRGIEIHSDLDDLVRAISSSKDTIWVTQKYIERPLIILRKKFDIRQLVLVTSVEPLVIWMHTKPYLRFSASDYDASNLKNKFVHLTNISISKQYAGYKPSMGKTKTKGKYKIKENMWDHT